MAAWGSAVVGSLRSRGDMVTVAVVCSLDDAAVGHRRK
jgi:hypothetical protein